MAERRRHALCGILLAMCVAAACSEDVDSRARLLDEECERATCATEGNAEQVTGITADSIGFRLGPGIGKLTIPLGTFSRAGTDSFSTELLLAGIGSYRVQLLQRACADAASCQATIVSESTGVVSEDPEWRFAGSFSGAGDTFSSFSIEIQTESTTERVDVIDVRYDAFQSVDCSVRAPGR
jgi:hypothetical protein